MLASACAALLGPIDAANLEQQMRAGSTENWVIHEFPNGASPAAPPSTAKR